MMYRNAAIVRNRALQIEREIKGMVTIMGNDALNFFKKSFTDQGFTHSGFTPWRKRKDKEGSYRRGRQRNASGGTISLNPGRGILVKTGDLKRSLKKVNVGRWAVTISTDKPYAEIHNEGLEGLAWGKHPFKMPQRKFMGYSATLNRKLIEKFDHRIKSVFNGR